MCILVLTRWVLIWISQLPLGKRLVCVCVHSIAMVVKLMNPNSKVKHNNLLTPFWHTLAYFTHILYILNFFRRCFKSFARYTPSFFLYWLLNAYPWSLSHSFRNTKFSFSISDKYSNQLCEFVYKIFYTFQMIILPKRETSPHPALTFSCV